MSMLVVSYVVDLSKVLSPKILHETAHLKGGLLLFLLIIGFLFATGEEGVVIVPGLLNRKRSTSSVSPSKQIPLTPRMIGSQLLLLLSFLLRLTCCCCSSVGTWKSLRGVGGFDLYGCCTR